MLISICNQFSSNEFLDLLPCLIFEVVPVATNSHPFVDQIRYQFVSFVELQNSLQFATKSYSCGLPKSLPILINDLLPILFSVVIEICYQFWFSKLFQFATNFKSVVVPIRYQFSSTWLCRIATNFHRSGCSSSLPILIQVIVPTLIK